MARIIYGAMVSNIRGSIGGTTFQANGFGYTVKQKPKMVIPLSKNQELSKLIMRKLTTMWRTLTDAERGTWNYFANTYPQYSAHNPLVKISGYTLWCMWGFQYLLATGANNDPWKECTTGLEAPITANFEVTSSEVYPLAINPHFSPSNFAIWCNIFMTAPVGKSVNFISSKFRFIGPCPCDYTSIDLAAEYLATFGLYPKVGERVGIRYIFYQLYGGRVAAALQQIVTVTAGV